MPDYRLNLAHGYTAHSLILGLVGRDKKILEVGCASGYLSEIFRRNGCTVTGMEIDTLKADAARQFCSRIVVGSIEDEETLEAVAGTYDVIVLADVLEHLRSPEKTLENLKSFLNEEGFLVVSLPNVANWKIRLNLLSGKFDYTDEGILDSTHLRFFTIKTARSMLEQSGYRVLEFLPGATRMPYFLVRLLPELFSVHMVFKAVTP